MCICCLKLCFSYYIIVIILARFRLIIFRMSKVNYHKKLEEKLRIYNQPFIEKSLLQKIIDKFAPNYKIYQLSSRGLIAPIRNWKLYLNKLYRGHVSRYAILGKYMEWEKYMVWWLHTYNMYWYSTQLADRITVYNTKYSWKREIAWAKFIFIKMRPSFFRWKIRKQSQKVFYYIMTPERALIQLLQETNWKPEFEDDICYQIETWKVNKKDMINLCKKYCSKNIQNLVSTFLKKC